mmetsp:Transcript_82513/g.129738  ORF Transcript_82513/g.129738 Transcript_82513/m.129738 type:complete len:288 (-) Transcript_82513:218-1081(-)
MASLPMATLPITGVLRHSLSGDTEQTITVPRPQMPHKAQPILIAFLIFPLITFSLTYALSLSLQQDGKTLIVYPSYFLSQSMARKPASCVGTFGLSFACMLLPIIALFRHRQIELKASKYFGTSDADDNLENIHRCKLLNDRALKTSCIAAVSGIGVASFQSALDDCGGTLVVKAIHWLFAGVFFVSGMVYCVLMWRIDRRVPGLGTSRAVSLRKWFAVLTGVQLFLLFVFLPVLFLTQMIDRKLVILFASGLEITLFLTFMSTYVTFYDDFAHTSFSLLVLDDRES